MTLQNEIDIRVNNMVNSFTSDLYGLENAMHDLMGGLERKEKFKKELSTLIQDREKKVLQKFVKWEMEHSYCDTDIIDEGGLEEYLKETK